MDVDSAVLKEIQDGRGDEISKRRTDNDVVLMLKKLSGYSPFFH